MDMKSCIVGIKNPRSTCTASSKYGIFHYDPGICPLKADVLRLKDDR